MAKSKQENKDSQVNPFLTDRADKLWEIIDRGGKPVTKEELLNRIRKIKRNK